MVKYFSTFVFPWDIEGAFSNTTMTTSNNVQAEKGVSVSVARWINGMPSLKSVYGEWKLKMDQDKINEMCLQRNLSPHFSGI